MQNCGAPQGSLRKYIGTNSFIILNIQLSGHMYCCIFTELMYRDRHPSTFTLSYESSTWHHLTYILWMVGGSLTTVFFFTTSSKYFFYHLTKFLPVQVNIFCTTLLVFLALISHKYFMSLQGLRTEELQISKKPSSLLLDWLLTCVTLKQVVVVTKPVIFQWCKNNQTVRFFRQRPLQRSPDFTSSIT